MKAILAAMAVVTLAATAVADDKAIEEEVAKWQGTWKAVSFERDGKPVAPEKLKPIKLTVEGAAYHFQNGDFNERGTYKFDPTASPKALDIVVGEGPDKGKVHQIIYKVDGDRLTICFQAAGKNRPHEFTGKAGSGNVLEEWQRVEP